jgi:hypothetical protein
MPYYLKRMEKILKLKFMKDNYTILQLSKDSKLPDWIDMSDNFVSIVRTNDELSIVCKTSCVQNDNELIQNKDWIIIKIEELLDLSLVGILFSLLKVLKDNEISVYTISTYNTDYILIKEKDKNNAINCLSKYYEVII